MQALGSPPLHYIFSETVARKYCGKEIVKWMKEGWNESPLVIALSCFLILLVTCPESEVVSE